MNLFLPLCLCLLVLAAKQQLIPPPISLDDADSNGSLTEQAFLKGPVEAIVETGDYTFDHVEYALSHVLYDTLLKRPKTHPPLPMPALNGEAIVACNAEHSFAFAILDLLWSLYRRSPKLFESTLLVQFLRKPTVALAAKPTTFLLDLTAWRPKNDGDRQELVDAQFVASLQTLIQANTVGHALLLGGFQALVGATDATLTRILWFAALLVPNAHATLKALVQDRTWSWPHRRVVFANAFRNNDSASLNWVHVPTVDDYDAKKLEEKFPGLAQAAIAKLLLNPVMLAAMTGPHKDSMMRTCRLVVPTDDGSHFALHYGHILDDPKHAVRAIRFVKAKRAEGDALTAMLQTERFFRLPPAVQSVLLEGVTDEIVRSIWVRTFHPYGDCGARDYGTFPADVRPIAFGKDSSLEMVLHSVPANAYAPALKKYAVGRIWTSDYSNRQETSSIYSSRFNAVAFYGPAPSHPNVVAMKIRVRADSDRQVILLAPPRIEGLEDDVEMYDSNGTLAHITVHLQRGQHCLLLVSDIQLPDTCHVLHRAGDQKTYGLDLFGASDEMLKWTPRQLLEWQVGRNRTVSLLQIALNLSG